MKEFSSNGGCGCHTTKQKANATGKLRAQKLLMYKVSTIPSFLVPVSFNDRNPEASPHHFAVAFSQVRQPEGESYGSVGQAEL